MLSCPHCSSDNKHILFHYTLWIIVGLRYVSKEGHPTYDHTWLRCGVSSDTVEAKTITMPEIFQPLLFWQKAFCSVQFYSILFYSDINKGYLLRSEPTTLSSIEFKVRSLSPVCCFIRPCSQSEKCQRRDTRLVVEDIVQWLSTPTGKKRHKQRKQRNKETNKNKALLRQRLHTQYCGGKKMIKKLEGSTCFCSECEVVSWRDISDLKNQVAQGRGKWIKRLKY